MRQVLVVDDEPAHRKGIIEILNKIHPEYLVLEAKDGQLAEAIMNSVNIDIVLTDIKMPNKDGLQFLEELRAKNDKTKVIIISGYGEFGYAQKAMSFGAFDFLLKPVDIDELNSVLDKAEKSFQKELESEQMKNEFNKVKLHYVDYLLNKLLRGSLTEDEEYEIKDVFQGFRSGFVFVIRTNTYFEQKHFDIKYAVRQIFDTAAHVITFEEQQGETILINFVFLEESGGFADCRKKITEIQNYFKEELNDNIYMGVSAFHNELNQNLREAYLQSKTALNYTFYSKDRIMDYDDIKTDETAVVKILSGKEADIINIVEYGEEKNIQAQLSELFNVFETAKNPNPNRLKEIFVLISMRILLSLKKKYTITEYEELMEKYSRVITQSQSLWELESNIQNMYRTLNLISRKNEDNSNNSIIMKSMEYIEKYYMEEISMERIAQKFYFSPSYFSIFFKNKTGVSFSQYLTELRVKNACRLLIDTNDKVNDICVKIGYNDPGYFGKVFKRKIGCSPEEYRKRNIQI